ncbi:hypothetical protein GCM10010399_11630 [Dactylosporangium fulvum]|uniref:EF-hand domain-containing protein n=1 Tax=Dactylosporangium fulvum TaxID=53359 RepID=A0ABY5W4V0_9ACTN|nr:hypothetical protein [Dactylosporangium fulvum]UWP84420.1 hypothetical protein Dfulv_09350 [Dactylosporangium fulvum]
MSDDYSGFTADVDGDGVEDPAEIYTLDDGSNVIVADTDGDGEADYAALDSDGDGRYELAYDANTGETIDLTSDDLVDYGADYDGSGGNLDGDVVNAEAGDTTTDTATTGDSGSYYDAAAVSDMLAMQHETSMAVINNI